MYDVNALGERQIMVSKADFIGFLRQRMAHDPTVSFDVWHVPEEEVRHRIIPHSDPTHS